MSAEPQFLSFKGLKQYTPGEGWGHVAAPGKVASKPIPDNVPTLTETPDVQAQDKDSPLSDQLIGELFDQLRASPNDELTQTWRTIAAEVNLLTQRMALQRELQDRLHKLDQDVAELRQSIVEHLEHVPRAAEQHLSSARLRAEVSALAQTKLSAKLKPSP